MRCSIGTGLKSVVANSLSGRIAQTGRKWRLLAGRNRTSVGAILLLGGSSALPSVTEDGWAAVYASRSDGRAIHGHGGSRREQHHGSRRHENDACDSFHPHPPEVGSRPSS